MKNCIEEYHSNPENILIEAGNYLENRQHEAYSSVAGLCNPVLSRNPFSSNFLLYFLQSKVTTFSYQEFLTANVIFFIKTLKSFAFEALMILLTPKREVNKNIDLVITSFFNFDRKKDSIFDELYLPQLQRDLIKNNRPYIYLPKLYNLSRNPFVAWREFKEIREQNNSFIAPYEIIPRCQIFSLMALLYGHYKIAMKTLRPDSSDFKDKCYNKALLESFQNAETYKFVQYLAMKKLIKHVRVKKIILWYENQVIDKCIIKAVREANENIQIYGCQFFLISKQEQNLYPSSYEIKSNLIPDKIFITQKLNFPTTIPERYVTGKGLRYQYLKKYQDYAATAIDENLTVFLTIYWEKNNIAYQILNNSFLKNKPLFIKKHPANSRDTIPNENWTEVKDGAEQLLLKSEVVFCTETGIVYEGMAMGRPVVILGSDQYPSHLIPPEVYKDKLWSFVTEGAKLLEAVEHLKRFKKDSPEEFQSLVSSVRDEFFRDSDKPISEILEVN